MIAIRVAAPADERRLAELEAATWSTAASPAPAPPSERDFFSRHEPENVLVAVDGEEIVGSLILGPWLPLASARHAVEVKGLAVDPDRQGEGIGSRLLEAAIGRVRGEGGRRLSLRVLGTNPGALRLYERHGFEVEGVHHGAFLLGGDYVDDVVLALDLTPAPPLSEATVVGVDVGGRRKGFYACALRGEEVLAGPTRLADVATAVAWIGAHDPAVVALDSPCECAPPGERSRPDERELNRAVCGIRWTPERSQLAGNPYYEWVEHGLELYEALAAAGIDGRRTIEVFPTAAWTIWAGPRARRPRGEWSAAALADLGLVGIPAGHLTQDDRDAVAAALVARLHVEGRVVPYGKIIVPASGSHGGRRRARTSPGPRAADRGRPAPGRPG